MPIYEYECSACGHQMEAIQKFSDAPLTECPACAKATLRKRISAPAFHLKGTGWYVTDFKDKPKTKGDSKKPAETTTKETDKPATTTESKPAATETTPTPKKTETSSSD